MKELARRWLAFADKDRQTCEQIKESRGLRAIAAFHVQQMIEKFLKAILVCQGQNPPRTHDLVRLAAPVTAAVGKSVVNPDELERINQYYTFSRYPLALEMDASEEPSAQELTSMVSTGSDERSDTSGGGPDHTT